MTAVAVGAGIDAAEQLVLMQGARVGQTRSGLQLTGGSFTQYLIASYASIEAALEPVKLFKGSCKGRCDLGSQVFVQPIDLD
jgi:hypothetical protein